MLEDPERCYQAAQSKDSRFDGWFFCAVTSTGIYCRPSCPARTPKRAEHALLPDRGGGAAGRLPGLPALPARRHPGLARVERAAPTSWPEPCGSSATASSTARV